MEIYKVEQLMPGIWAINEQDAVRCFLLEGNDRALLVDTGFGGGDLRAVVEGLTSKPVTVVITHADGDHTGCCRQFSEVYLHPADFDRYYSSPNACAHPKPLWEGTVMDLGGVRLEVILIPGHTPGSIVMLDRERRLLISGDSVQTDNIYMFNPGRNIYAFRQSLLRLRQLEPCYDHILASHGQAVIGPEVLHNIISGVDRLLAGQLTAQPPLRDLPCKLYRFELAGFYY